MLNMKTVLIISYAFPPLSVTGSFRPLRFTKYLPDFGWNPIVIAVKGRNDIPRDPSLLDYVPKDLQTFRVKSFEPFCFFSSRNNALEGNSQYLQNFNHVLTMPSQRRREVINVLNNLVSIPDPMMYWIPSVVFKGAKIHSSKPYQAIITTSPPHSSHLAGLCLATCFQIPWFVDFRDPWVDNVFFSVHKTRLRRLIESWLERLVLTKATGIVANTSPNRQRLLARYSPDLPESKFSSVTNGFDKQYIDAIPTKSYDKFTICHTGVFYSILKPYFFFEAFAYWLEHHGDKRELRNSIQLLLVGSQSNEIERLIHRLHLKDVVSFLPRVTHKEALSLTKSADLLLIDMGFTPSALGWIPLKAYDYLGSRRPILGILPHGSAMADLIRSTNTGYVVSQRDYRRVSRILDTLYSRRKTRGHDSIFSPNETELNKYEIRNLTKNLAGLLERSIR